MDGARPQHLVAHQVVSGCVKMCARTGGEKGRARHLGVRIVSPFRSQVSLTRRNSWCRSWCRSRPAGPNVHPTPASGSCSISARQRPPAPAGLASGAEGRGFESRLAHSVVLIIWLYYSQNAVRDRARAGCGPRAARLASAPPCPSQGRDRASTATPAEAGEQESDQAPSGAEPAPIPASRRRGAGVL
jgi:hypothetical protein